MATMDMMDDDWDMCEAILSFSVENQDQREEEENKENMAVDENKASSTPNPSEKSESKENVIKPNTKVATKQVECLFHGASHRSNFQRLLNLLRTKPNLVPAKYMYRVGQTVCGCKTDPTQTESTLVSYEDSDLKLETDFIVKHFHGTDKAAINTVLERLLTPGAQNHSVLKLYEVLCNARNGFYSKPECPKAKVVQGNEEPPKFKEAVTLPLPNEFVPHLIGKNGVHINALTRKYGIELSIVSPCSLRRVPYKAPLGPNAIVELTAPKQEDIDAAKGDLTEKAKYITRKREKHKRAMAEHREYLRQKWEITRELRKNRREPIYNEIMYGTNTDGGYMKEMDRKSHISKYKQQRKTGNTLRAKPAPVLEGSTCINCLGHYNGKEKNTTESCRYHPGFLVEAHSWVEFRWKSCKHVMRCTRNEMMLQYKLDLTSEPSNKRNVEKSYYIWCKQCTFHRVGGIRYVTWSAEKEQFWNCCKCLVVDRQFAVNSKEDKHEMHAEEGCKTGLHTWRPQRSNKGTNRVKVQSAGKKNGKTNYDLNQISKGIKGINMSRHGKAIEEAMDQWVVP